MGNRFENFKWINESEAEYKDDVFFLDADVRQMVTDCVVAEYNDVVESDDEEDAPKQRKRK